jgi:hypothetical protein
VPKRGKGLLRKGSNDGSSKSTVSKIAKRTKPTFTQPKKSSFDIYKLFGEAKWVSTAYNMIPSVSSFQNPLKA